MGDGSRIIGWFSSLFVSFLARLIVALKLRCSLKSWRQDLGDQLVVELRRRGVPQGIIAEMFETSAESIRCWTRRWEGKLERERDLQPLSAWRLTALVRLQASRGQWIPIDELRAGRCIKCYDTWFHAMIRELEDAHILERSADGLRCRVAAPARLREAFPARDVEVEAHLVWACIYRHGPVGLTELASLMDLSLPEIMNHVALLEASGRIALDTEDEPLRWGASCFEAPPGEPARWESALYDHFSAVFDAVICRLDPAAPPPWKEATSGSTYSFDLWPGHPEEQRVRALLNTIRETVRPVVTDHRQHLDDGVVEVPSQSEIYRVVLYLGQGVVQPGVGASRAEVEGGS